ncbi:MAG TPA: T9SS type A sorting domain-containing protein [Paludibacteraceae bacterium]|nr:T9SS type A sorting domain-containing protein [Paludibacteraceae bacterium]
MKIVCKNTNNNLSKQIFLLFLPKHQCSQTTSPIFGSNTVLGAIFVASVSAFFRGSSQEWRARAYLALCTVKIRSAFKSGTSYYDFAYVNVEQQAVGVKLQIVTPPTSVTQTTHGNMLVYPNPANDVLYINTGTSSKTGTNYSIKIVNTLGQTVFETVINNQLVSVDVSTLGANGIYFIQLMDQNGKIQEISKFIRE